MPTSLSASKLSVAAGCTDLRTMRKKSLFIQLLCREMRFWMLPSLFATQNGCGFPPVRLRMATRQKTPAPSSARRLRMDIPSCNVPASEGLSTSRGRMVSAPCFLLQFQLGSSHQSLPTGNFVNLVLPQFSRAGDEQRRVETGKVFLDFR